MDHPLALSVMDGSGPAAASLQLIRRIDLLDVCSVRGHGQRISCFSLFALQDAVATGVSGGGGSIGRSQKSKIAIPGWGGGAAAWLLQQELEYECRSPEDCFDCVMCIEYALRRRWQRFWEEESAVVLSPHIYQDHYLVTKINRRSVAQVRYLVLSSAHLYNIEPKTHASGGGRRVMEPARVKVILSVVDID